MAKYFLQMEFANPTGQSFLNPNMQQSVRQAEQMFNNYYLVRTVPNPKRIKVVPQGKWLDIELDTKKPLTDGREGNALRQFSRFLLRTGFPVSGNPGKLLRRK